MELSSGLKAKRPTPYKIVILGDGYVGKSALTIQFVARTFVDDLDPTIEDSYMHQCMVGEEVAQLDILDTAGQHEFRAMRAQYMTTGRGFILCYSVSDKRSYEEIHEYRRLIAQMRPEETIPIILVGNKCDLDEDLREVTKAEGVALASRYNWLFYETSALTHQGVDEIFHQMVCEIRFRESLSDADDCSPCKTLIQRARKACLKCINAA